MYFLRNDLSDYLRENNYFDIDIIAMIIADKDTISYRSIKDIDCSVVTTFFGGKGHKYAASSPQDNFKFTEIKNKISS